MYFVTSTTKQVSKPSTFYVSTTRSAKAKMNSQTRPNRSLPPSSRGKQPSRAPPTPASSQRRAPGPSQKPGPPPNSVSFASDSTIRGSYRTPHIHNSLRPEEYEDEGQEQDEGRQEEEEEEENEDDRAMEEETDSPEEFVKLRVGITLFPPRKCLLIVV